MTGCGRPTVTAGAAQPNTFLSGQRTAESRSGPEPTHERTRATGYKDGALASMLDS